MKDFWAEELQNQRKSKLKKLSILIIFIILICVIATLIIIYMINLDFRIWCDENVLIKEVKQENTKSIELDGDENAQVYAYDKYICIFRKKELEIYNKVGTKIATLNIDINKAVFNSAGRYLAIAEENGQKFYLIEGKEKLYNNEIEGNISQIYVNSSGYVSIVLTNTSYKSIVDIYNRDGKEMFKTNLATSRVIDVSLSRDNKFLAIAEVDLSGILVKSSIQEISIETAQKDPENAIINKYEASTDKLITNIEYQEGNSILCMYNNSIEILQNQESKEIINFDDKNLTYMSIDLDNRMLALEEVSTGEYSTETHVMITKPQTLKMKEYIIGNVAKEIYTYQNKIAINFGKELYIMNTNGILLKKYISETEINDVVITESLVGVLYRDSIQIINL